MARGMQTWLRLPLFFTVTCTIALAGAKVNVKDAPLLKAHKWQEAEEHYAKKLIELQHPEGYWVNTEKRWMEDNKSLVTAYCLIVLDRCRPFLGGK